ncbi:ABC transporter substrate-binding protein [Elioraea tepida]|uniref:ABC transporter substrate-binding protein n=1 Tax=Elioraea tepida TaxID=2843330 RepID=A0A975U3I3_9PROT|nr:ABC transporter substrate-binding protein [Elioraea tepida]QXM25634.1 ABC transporter substrate-binding protein [Elioraea tepida]
MRRRQVLAAAGLALALRPASAQNGEVRLGALYPLSGARALLGDEGFRGLELACEERNAGGGVAGAKVRLVRADATDPASAAAEARRLITVERVRAIFGTHASSLSLAATQAAEQAGVPYFELGAIADAITDRGFRSVFRSAPPARAWGEVAIEALAAIARRTGRDERLIRVAVLREEGVLGTAVSSAQKERAAARGLILVEDIPYSMRTADLTAAVLRLRDAQAEVVLHSGYQNDIILFYRAMRAARWKPLAVIGSGEGYALAETQKAIGPDFQNTMIVDVPPLAVSERIAPGAKAFAEAYVRRYGHAPRTGLSLSNFVGARLFLEALARSGGGDRDRVRAAVLALDVPEHSLANGWGAKFDEAGQNTRARPFLAQWQGEQVVTVLPEKAAVAELRLGLGAS